MANDIPLYNFWNEYPTRDVEYIRWYPPTLGPLDPKAMWSSLPAHPGKTLAFYVHVPLCKDICPYCPFNKYSWKADRARTFAESIESEIRLVVEQPFVQGAV